MAEHSQAVASFRARFEAVEEEERSSRASALAGDAQQRLRECLDLHALNLLLDLERARQRPGISTLREAIVQVNRERREAAPMPPSLLGRWRQRDDAL